MSYPTGRGTLGRASSATSRRGYLSNRGRPRLLAYNAWGHEYLTNEAIKEALKNLPANLAWVRHFLKQTSTPAVYRDVEDVFTRDHWKPGGQRHHFMRHATQTEQQAYALAITWIHNNAYKAAKNLRRVWKENLGHYNSLFVNEPLGDALHALQDSFAYGHVTRKKFDNIHIITKIHVYDEKNKTPSGDWAGHKKLDEQWRGKMGQEALAASRELVRIVVWVSLQQTEQQFNLKWKSLWKTFADMFLSTSLGKAIKA